MVESVNVLNDIIEELMLTPGAKRTSLPDQIHVRCRFCGDSQNKNSAHMYVGISRKDSSKLGYECKKCSTAGYVNEDFLKLYDIDPTQYLRYLKSNTSGLRKTFDMNKNKKLDVRIPDIIKSSDRFKVEYIEKRLGRKITPEDIDNMKIVLNLNQFLNYNKIDAVSLLPKLPINDTADIKFMNDRNNRYIETINELSNNFFGFLSSNNNRITMRNMGSVKMTEKYHVFTIDPSISDPFIYYPKMKIDICSDCPEIVMTEGVFDILNVREKFYSDRKDLSNVFFVAVGGSGSYRRCLKNVLKMTGFIDGHVTIFSDADISMDNYKKIFLEYSNYLKFKIIYNTSSKDFGDSSEPINPRSYRLTWN